VSTRWRTYLKLLALTVWGLTLFASAVPDPFLTSKLQAERHRLEKHLGRVSLTGGRSVFNTDSSTRRLRALSSCLMVIGVHTDGRQEEIYSDWPGCKEPSIRLRGRVLSRAISRLTRRPIHATLSQRADVQALQTLSTFSQIFCEAPGHTSPVSIYLVFRSRVLRKATGKQPVQTSVIHYTDCATGDSEPPAWPEIQLVEKPYLRWGGS